MSGMARRPVPWGMIAAVAAAVVLAAPTLLLPAGGPTWPKVIFAAVGAALLVAAIISTRREPGAKTPDPAPGSDEVSPSGPGPTSRG